MALSVLACSQASAILIARVLGPEGKGATSVLLGIVSLGAIVFDFGITGAAVYFVGREKERVEETAATLATAGLLLGMLGSLLVYLFAVDLARLLFEERFVYYVRLSAFVIPSVLLNGWILGVLRGLKELNQVSIVGATTAAAGFVFLAVGLLVLHIGVAVVVWQLLLTSLLGLIAAVKILRSRGIRLSLSYTPSVFRNMLRYGLRGYIGAVLQFLNYRLDIFIVAALLGTKQAGIYSVSAALAQIILQVPNAAAFVALSHVVTLDDEDAVELTKDLARRAFLACVLLAVAIAATTPLVLPLLFGKEFDAGVASLWILLPGVVSLAHLKVIAAYLAGRGRPGLVSMATSTAGILTIGLDLVLIPRIGIEGAALASTIAYATSSLVAILAFRKLGENVPLLSLVVPRKSDITALREIWRDRFPRIRRTR